MCGSFCHKAPEDKEPTVLILKLVCGTLQDPSRHRGADITTVLSMMAMQVLAWLCFKMTGIDTTH